MSITKKWLVPLLGLAFAGISLAQSIDQSKFYKLEFVVKEVEGSKTVNSRSFVTMLAVQVGSESKAATIRAGGRVPITVSGSTQMQYYDVGVNIDAKDLREMQSDLSITISADISWLVQENQPMTRQNRWAGTVILPAKKPTVIFASDDMSSKRALQLELTATPVK